MATKWCKLVGQLRSIIGDGADSDDYPDASPLSGRALLTPLVSREALIPELGGSLPADVSYVVGDIEVEFVDGRLSYGGKDFVYLLSSVPALEGGTLHWRMIFGEMTDGAGNSYRPGAVTFDTVPGGEVSLSRIQPIPGFEQSGVTKGDSAYDIAVQNGFSGSVDDWLLSLKHPTVELGTDWVPLKLVDDKFTGSCRLKRVGSQVFCNFARFRQTENHPNGKFAVLPSGFKPPVYNTVMLNVNGVVWRIEVDRYGHFMVTKQYPNGYSWGTSTEIGGVVSWLTEDPMPTGAVPQGEIKTMFDAAMKTALANTGVEKKEITASNGGKATLKKFGHLVHMYIRGAQQDEVFFIPAGWEPDGGTMYGQLIDIGASNPSPNALATIQDGKARIERTNGKAWGTVAWMT